MQGQIAGLVAPPALASRNSGFDLEAVVEAPESAANRILEAAEAIAAWANGAQRDPAALHLRVNAIFEACTFQDLTGQRLRRAIEHLQGVEAMLDRMAPGGVAQPPPPMVTSTGGTGPDIDQGEVDRLLAF